MPLSDLILDPAVLKAYVELVEAANSGRSHWTCIKRFRLVPDTVSIVNGLLTPTLKIKRSRVRERFSEEIESMYGDAEPKPPVVAIELPREAEHGSDTD